MIYPTLKFTEHFHTKYFSNPDIPQNCVKRVLPIIFYVTGTNYDGTNYILCHWYQLLWYQLYFIPLKHSTNTNPNSNNNPNPNTNTNATTNPNPNIF